MTTPKDPARRQTTTKKSRPAKASEKAPKKNSLAKRAQAVTLITGGTGFLGAHLVQQLIETGEKKIRVMATSIPAWLAELGVETIEGSVARREDVARAVAGASGIYHLAGRVSHSGEDSHELYALHVEGTRLLCEAARSAGVKNMVLASTSGTVAVTETGDAVPDEEWPTPLDIVTRWPYYASKIYQEKVALENFTGDGRRLVIMNPSLLLGPGDERLSSTKVILDFLSRKIMSVPSGGLNFVDVRDAAAAFRAAMSKGEHGERYLLGAANWTFADFFARLERQTKTAAPRFSLPSKLTVPGAKAFHALYRHWNLAPPVEPAEIQMAEHFWYFDWSKAERQLGFTPRDPAETLHDTITYVRQHFLGNSAFN